MLDPPQTPAKCRGMPTAVKCDYEWDRSAKGADHAKWRNARVIALDMDDFPATLEDIGADTWRKMKIAALGPGPDTNDLHASGVLSGGMPAGRIAGEDRHRVSHCRQPRSDFVHVGFRSTHEWEVARCHHQDAQGSRRAAECSTRPPRGHVGDPSDSGLVHSGFWRRRPISLRIVNRTRDPSLTARRLVSP